MKKVVLFFAVVASVAIFASCGPKQAANTGDTDTVGIETVDTTVVLDDTTAIPVDTAAVPVAE